VKERGRGDKPLRVLSVVFSLANACCNVIVCAETVTANPTMEGRVVRCIVYAMSEIPQEYIKNGVVKKKRRDDQT